MTASLEQLYHPDRETFVEQAAVHRLVPVWREVLADLSTPLAVYHRVRASEGPTFLLESVEHGERWGRYSFVGAAPLCSLTARGGATRLDGAVSGPLRAAVEAAADPLEALRALLEGLAAPWQPDLPPLWAGAVGYLGWDVVHAIERLPARAHDDLGLDDVRLLLPGQVVAFDHLRQRLLVVVNVLVDPRERDPAAAYDDAVAQAEALVQQLAEPLAAPTLAPPRVGSAATVEDAAGSMTSSQYEAAVEAAQERIRAGDAFQVVPSQRWSLSTSVDPLLVYRVLRVINPSPYMFVFEWDDLQVVGSSPEALVTVKGDVATIQPIAGSRPRGRDDEEDAAHEASLRVDEKELAEHVMLVDLARNDLGRISRIGSVQVTERMQVVRYSHIMHLVSRVQGRLRSDVGAVDVLRATFPAGTLSGAPKVSAMRIIDELEPLRRGIYGGGIGYLDLQGNADLCIAIRTLVFAGGSAHVQAGAGVVADSVPASEDAECRAKATALLAAVRAAEALVSPT